jgi:lipopolysaccharide transport system permease protein
VKAVLTAQATMVVGMVAAVAGAIITHRVSALILFLPVVWFLQVLALIGVTWILSLVNVFVRDLQNVLNAVLMILLIASPILYTPDQVPQALKLILVLNPLAYFIVAYQEVVILGYVPTAAHIVGIVVMSVGLFWVGSIAFARAKNSLIDNA